MRHATPHPAAGRTVTVIPAAAFYGHLVHVSEIKDGGR